MAEALPGRNMEAMLVHPTLDMSKNYSPSQPHIADDSNPSQLPDPEGSDWNETAKTSPKSIAIPQHFRDDFVFPRGYASEEEAPSPTDYDDSGFGFTSSDSDSTLSLDDAEITAQPIERANATQLCARAQPVHFVSVGKAKVVCVSSSAESSPIDNGPRLADDGTDRRMVIFGSSKTHARSQTISSEKRSYPLASTPTAESAIEPQVPRRRGTIHVPRLDAAPTSVPPLPKHFQTPLANQRADLSKPDSSRSEFPMPSPISPTSPRRRLKISTNFSIRAFGVPRRENSCSSNGSGSAEGDYRFEPRARSTTSPFSEVSYTPRTMLVEKPKMVPRGANEREPPLILPPCPDDYVDDADVEYSPRWRVRDDLALNTSGSDRSSPLKHLRRKSLSAAAATTVHA